MIGYVYILICSKTDEIVYVGSTCDLYSRLSCHKSYIKTSHLPLYKYFRKKGSIPLMEVVDKVRVRYKQDSKVFAVEKYWVDILIKCGFNILNQQGTLKFNKKLSKIMIKNHKARKETVASIN